MTYRSTESCISYWNDRDTRDRSSGRTLACDWQDAVSCGKIIAESCSSSRNDDTAASSAILHTCSGDRGMMVTMSRRSS